MRCAPAWVISRSAMFAAANVLPEPVAIWISARGLLSCSDCSRFVIAACWASRSHGVWSVGGSGSMSWTRARSDPPRPSMWSSIWSASVSG